MSPIRQRLETFGLEIEELQAEVKHASGYGNRNSAVELDKEISHADLTALLETSETQWAQVKSEVEKVFSDMRTEIGSLEASLRARQKAAGSPEAAAQGRFRRDAGETE
jgi:hypothetical protein